MKFQKTLLASSISLMLLGLSGCGDSDSQDIAADDATSFTGLVVDDRIARGFVWLDTDQDAIVDTYEPYAYTDTDGYCSYNPLTNTNYCAVENHIHCLKTGMVDGDFQIRIAGGIDLGTGEPFKGVLTLNMSIEEAKEVEQQMLQASAATDAKPDFMPVISPFSSLILPGASADEIEAVLIQLGVPAEVFDTYSVEDILGMDFTDLSGDDAELNKLKAQLFLTAFSTQKQIDLITAMLDAYIEEQGIDLGQDEDGNPGVGSTASGVTQLLAETLADAANGGNGKFANVNATAFSNDDGNTNFTSVLNIAFSNPNVVAVTVDGPLTPVPEEHQTFALDIVTQASATSQQILDSAIDSIISEGAPTSPVVRAALTLGQVGNNVWTELGTNKSHRDLDEAGVANIGNGLRNIVDAATDVISSDDDLQIDTVVLSKSLQEVIFFNFTVPNLNALIDNAKLPNGPDANADGIFAKRVLSLSGKSEDGEAGRVLFFFDAESTTSKSGDVAVCYAANANNDDDDIEPTYMKATWSEVGNRVSITVNHALADFTIKARAQAPIPAENVNDVVGLQDGDVSLTDNYGHFRFINDDVDETWYSDIKINDVNDVTDYGLGSFNGDAPTTADGCASYTINGVANALTKNLGF
jgi:hypothetical protein